MKICPARDVESLLSAEPGIWNVISACKERPPRELCANYCHLNCDDLNEENLRDARFRQQIAAGWMIPPNRQHVENALRFARQHGNENLLIYCREAVSRSPAYAWCILFNQHGSIDKATSALFALRPQCNPNDLIVRIGVEIITGSEELLPKVLMSFKEMSCDSIVSSDADMSSSLHA